jgi:adenine deaminase
MLDLDRRRTLIDVARGAADADLVLANARLINVFTREILLVDIAIAGGFVAAIAPHGSEVWASRAIQDLEGRFVSPGFMDPHVHVESSLMTVTEYARAAIQRGVTMIAIDPHEIGNVLGVPGMTLMLEEAACTPLRVKLRVPGRIPAMPAWLETSGAYLDVAETVRLLDHPDAVCLAGDINPYLLIGKDGEQLDKIDAARARRMTVSGQSPALRGRDLNAFIAAGPEDSHVASSIEEILDNQRLGLRSIIALRRGMLHRPQFRAIADYLTANKIEGRYLQFCTDDVNAHELLDVGHLDTRIRIAIEEGFDPYLAYQMATINVAEGLRIDPEFGAIAPGRAADLVVIGAMEKVDVSATMIAGEWVHGPNAIPAAHKIYAYPQWARETMRVGALITAEDLQVTVMDGVNETAVRTIRNANVPKLSDTVMLPVRDHVVLPDPARQVSSIAIIDRHQASKRIGRGFVSGFYVRQGALASTVSHDAHNLMVIGADLDDMAIAANRAIENGGGYAVVLHGKVIFELPLPIAGLMSDQPVEQVAERARTLINIIHDQLGAPRIHDQILHLLNFLALPNIPNFGFTDYGLIATDSLEVLDVTITPEGAGCCSHAIGSMLPA